MTPGFEGGRVVQARLLSSGIRNLTIAAAARADANADADADVAFAPGADVALRVPAAGGATEERRYSIWRSATQPDAGTFTFDVCIVLHGLGPGSRWAAGCTIGDPVEFARSRTPPIALDPRAGAHVFLGDETSIAATEALRRALPPEATVLAAIEVDSPAQVWAPTELVQPESLRWVARAGRPGTALVAWLARQSLPPAPITTAYVTGEAWLCTLVQSHLVREHGLCPAAVRALPYWRRRPAPTA